VPTSSTPWPSLFTKHLQNGTGVLSSSPINCGSRKRCGLHFDGVVTAWTLRALEVALAGGCSNLNTVDKNRLSRYELSKLLIEKGIRIKSLDSKSLYHPSDADKVAGAESIESVFVPSLLGQMGHSAKENITNWAAPYLDRHMKFPQRTLVVYNLGTLDNDIERANANCFLSSIEEEPFVDYAILNRASLNLQRFSSFSNVHVISEPNIDYPMDLCSYGVYLLRLKLKVLQYDFFFALNEGSRGPFSLAWVKLFRERAQESHASIVGSMISIEKTCHVQTHAFGMDHRALRLFLGLPTCKKFNTWPEQIERTELALSIQALAKKTRSELNAEGF